MGILQKDIKKISVEWTTKKPKFDKECLLITAVKIRKEWEYQVFIIDRVWCENKWYWGLLTGDAEEYGAIEDLKADKYCVLPLLK